MATYVIDTADWRLVVPLRSPLDLRGSRLVATLAPALGGPAAVSVDSQNSSIAWDADPVSHLTTALFLVVPKAARAGWLALEATSLVFDIHRTVQGSTIDEWLGRSAVRVLPATDSPLVAQRARFAPVLIAGQPNDGVVLPALAIGPQGPSNIAYIDARIAQLQAQIDALTGRSLSGRIAASGLAPAALVVEIALAGGVPGQGVLAGALSTSTTILLAGAVPAGAGLGASLALDIALAGTLGGGALTGALAFQDLLSGDIVGGGDLEGSLAVAIALSGALPAPSGPAGAATITVAAAGGLPAPDGPRAKPSVSGFYVGAINGGGALTGAAVITVPLSGAVPAGAVLTGAPVLIPAAVLVGELRAPAGPRAALTVTPGLVNARKGRLAAATAA